MTLCLSHRFPLVFITAATTARECLLLLSLVDLDDNRVDARGLVELVDLHLGVRRRSRGMVLVYYHAGHVRTHLGNVDVYHFHFLLNGNLFILHFFNLLQYLIIHFPLGLSFLELISLLPLILSGPLVLLLFPRLRPLLLLPGSLLLAVYAHTQCD